MTGLVFGIDPGKVTGWALVAPPGVPENVQKDGRFQVCCAGQRDWENLLVDLDGVLASYDVELVAIEGYEFQGAARAPGIAHQAWYAGIFRGFAFARHARIRGGVVVLRRTEVLSGLRLRRYTNKAAVRSSVMALATVPSPLREHEIDAVAAAIVGSGRMPALAKRA